MLLNKILLTVDCFKWYSISNSEASYCTCIMSLDKFGNHIYGTMTVDKFGKHIQEHSVLKHLQKPKIIQKSFKDSWLDFNKLRKQRFVLTLSGDGQSSVYGTHKITNKGGEVVYTNELFIGNILKVVIHGSVWLLINGHKYDPGKNITIKPKDKLQVMQITGGSGTGFCIEILIESNNEKP